MCIRILYYKCDITATLGLVEVGVRVRVRITHVREDLAVTMSIHFGGLE